MAAFTAVRIENIDKLPDPNDHRLKAEHEMYARAIRSTITDISYQLDWSFWDNGELLLLFDNEMFYRVDLEELNDLQHELQLIQPNEVVISICNYTF